MDTIKIISEIICLASFGWVFTVHKYIQDFVKQIPKYKILNPFIKILQCTKCFSFNFSLIYFLINKYSVINSLGFACVVCVIASLIFNSFLKK